MKKIDLKFLMAGGILCLVLLLMPLTANAACSNPAGDEGNQIYNTTYRVMQYCDGTTWISMKGGVGTEADTLASLSCADGEVAKWNNGGSVWECTTDNAGAGGDDLGNHTATAALNMGSNNILNAGTIQATGSLQIDGNTNISSSGSYMRTYYGDNTRYGYYEGRTSAGTRGFYLGYGNGGTQVNLYLDNASRLEISGGLVDMNSNKIEGVATPTAGTDAANKAYVDGLTGSNETDPQVSTVTNNKWCRGNGSAVVCDQDAPGGSSGAVLGGTGTRSAGFSSVCDGTLVWGAGVCAGSTPSCSSGTIRKIGGASGVGAWGSYLCIQ